MSKEDTTNQTNPTIKRITIGPSRIGGQKMPADLPDEYGKYITSLEKAYDKLSAKNKALIEAVEAKGTCAWKYDENSEVWETSCDNLYCIIDGTPTENKMKFCTYCGKQIESE